MTRHKKPEEWIEEIMEAAATEIELKGYPALTMEAIVRRTSLSKGGVYRFFKNKDDVALSLFTKCYRESTDFEVEDVVRWRLPIDETFLRLVTRFNVPEKEAVRNDRIWLRLVPQVLVDERYSRLRNELLARLRRKLLILARRLAQRDGLVVSHDFDEKVSRSLTMAVALLEGFTIQSSLGSPLDEQIELMRQFVRGVMQSVLEPDSQDNDKSAASAAARN